MDPDSSDTSSLLIDNYFNKKIFTNPSINNIYEELKKEAPFSGITKLDVKLFQQSLYELSRSRENRILRGKKRYFSHRSWTAFAPGKIAINHTISQTDNNNNNCHLDPPSYPIYKGNILLADLCFIRPINTIKRTPISHGSRTTILLITMDLFS